MAFNRVPEDLESKRRYQKKISAYKIQNRRLSVSKLSNTGIYAQLVGLILKGTDLAHASSRNWGAKPNTKCQFLKEVVKSLAERAVSLITH